MILSIHTNRLLAILSKPVPSECLRDGAYIYTMLSTEAPLSLGLLALGLVQLCGHAAPGSRANPKRIWKLHFVHDLFLKHSKEIISQYHRRSLGEDY